MARANVEKVTGPCPGCGGYQVLKVQGRIGWWSTKKAKQKLAAAEGDDKPAKSKKDVDPDDKPAKKDDTIFKWGDDGDDGGDGDDGEEGDE